MRGRRLLRAFNRFFRKNYSIRASEHNRQVVYEDNNLMIQVQDRESTGNICLVSFTGVGHGLGGIDLQTPEFTRSGLNGPKIFVIDKQRSWGNDVSLETIEEVTGAYSVGRQVITLGNSMGGFLAILLSGPLEADHCLAFTPQWSIDPRIVPEEKRWMSYRRKIETIRYPDLSKSFETACRYTCLFGDSRDEEIHSSRFPSGLENLEVYKFKNAEHDLAAYLKERGCLYPLIEGVLAGLPPSRLFASRNMDFSLL